MASRKAWWMRDPRARPRHGLKGCFWKMAMAYRGWLVADDPLLVVEIVPGPGDVAGRLCVSRQESRSYRPSPELLEGRYRK
ncbi:MAG: hypothetical protein U9Q03_01445 [Patescibacteria group bacterium]|nr:hypothetical protein [Patescibacteria group bacterium]